jgi:5,10-methenyltetrahydromethanopterin hydrogenase
MPKSKINQHLRAASAGAMLAQQLRNCIQAKANDQPYPPVDAVDFEGPDDVGNAFGMIAAICGIYPADEDDKARACILMTALAEMIAEQGGDLEASFFNLISEDHSKMVVRNDKEETAA